MRVPILAALLLSASPAAAELRVLADAAPVHSLVAMVMGDLGTPGLIVPPGTSPHHASLSPSEARAVAEADLIVWTGEDLLPWLGEALASLAPGTPALSLLETDGWEPLPLREGAHLDTHAAGEEHGAEHGQHEGDHGEGGALDPHAWLDPNVAVAWLGSIASALAEADPANAETYRANAAEAAQGLAALGGELRGRFASASGGYAVGHDAYQYLERALGLPAAWAVADAGGQEAAPGDAAALREAVLAGEVTCLLLDAETDEGWAETLGEGTELRSARVDPDGVSLEPGPELYPQLMREMADALEGCLAP